MLTVGMGFWSQARGLGAPRAKLTGRGRGVVKGVCRYTVCADVDHTLTFLSLSLSLSLLPASSHRSFVPCVCSSKPFNLSFSLAHLLSLPSFFRSLSPFPSRSLVLLKQSFLTRVACLRGSVSNLQKDFLTTRTLPLSLVRYFSLSFSLTLALSFVFSVTGGG